MASREEQLLAEVARLQARNEQLEEEIGTLRQQEVKDKTVQKDDDQEEERPRKKQKTHHEKGENQLAHGTKRDVACPAHHQLPEDQQQVVTASATIVQILPTELLGRALDFLPFSKRRDFFIGNHDLWKRVRVEYETQIMCDLILDRVPRLGFLSHDFTSVCRLNFGLHCSDTALAVLCNERAFPQLAHLAMARSVDVTDKGLRLLPENRNRRKNLVSLDIAFCPRTSLEVTFLLRDLFINLQVLRRQPEWMDGQVLHWNGERVVYWADGTHVIYGPDGEMVQCGYIRNFFEESPSHRVVCKNQVVYTSAFEDESWQSQPEWMRHAYCPGSSLLYLPDGQSKRHWI